ncbi:class I SAM-dependent methyltransferase [Krasilnikovia sp. M28-CT-15]|uniref:class I SAM-dependent methyltransferase n=1 Tax=Krasilnikovia sp. M28-CT-15 TaxID=3373540 RepID=UPI0038769BC9
MTEAHTRPLGKPGENRLDRPIDLAHVVKLYATYADDLARVREEQRRLLTVDEPRMRARLDDIEAEITYLLVRDVRPALVAEIGTFYGWSTTWLLRALRDNGTGRLHSYDIVDHVRRTVPAELSAGRWTFHQGDVRASGQLRPDTVDFLFIDAAHTASFARWYTRQVLPRVRTGVPVSVHDVHQRLQVGPFSEGRVVLGWLGSRGIAPFTAAPRAAREAYETIVDVKRSLGLAEPVHAGGRNPMIFFRAQ